MVAKKYIGTLQLIVGVGTCIIALAARWPAESDSEIVVPCGSHLWAELVSLLAFGCYLALWIDELREAAKPVTAPTLAAAATATVANGDGNGHGEKSKIS